MKVPARARGFGRGATRGASTLAKTIVMGLTLLGTDLAAQDPDSARADSIRADSARADSIRADSASADSLRADSLRADSLRADSLRSDSLRGASASAAVALPAVTPPPAAVPQAGPASQESGASADADTSRIAGAAQAAPDPVGEGLRSLAESVSRLAQAQDSLAAHVSRLAGAQPDSTLTPGAALEATAEEARRIGTRSVLAVLIISMAFLVMRAMSWLLDLLAERHAARRLLYKRLVPILRVLIWALTTFIILRGVFAFETQTLLAAGAAVGVAIGFAAQDILKNIFGGLVIIGDRPFQVGDKVAVGETYGEVKTIGLRSTRIVTPDDNLVSVPNAQIVAGQVANANAGALDCQVVTDLWLPGWVDARQAKEIAYRAAATSRYVYLKKPVVVIVKDEVHHTFLTHLKVKAYVQDIRHEFLFMSDVTERARAAFVEAGLLPEWHGATAFTNAPGAGAFGGAPRRPPPGRAPGDGSVESVSGSADPAP